MTLAEKPSGKKLQVSGVVQGVGFRPFVYRLAREHHLSGWVCNTSRWVEIVVEGAAASLERFVQELTSQSPALARIDSLVVEEAEPQGREGFTILESRRLPGAEALIPADASTCADCFREIMDPGDRRYYYPFTNCTNCGPRFTIIQSVPYDRPRTTMAAFAMCPRCREEYENPEDRRFHAEPTACPECGPRVWLEEAGRVLEGDALKAAGKLLREGKVVAIKGLGGFHLACDARQAPAVASLRDRKGRVGKPFAVMVRDLAEAQRLGQLDGLTTQLLLSPERPIVLARKREDCDLAPQVAPHNKYLGLMLPYTPLHLLLFSHAPAALVMTSGNLSEEPLVFTNDGARIRLASLADAFLLHNRDIQVPCDDSVVRPVAGRQVIPLRRARGFVPQRVSLPVDSEPILAVGAEQKNTFCLAWKGLALLSQHLGDLDTVETFDYFQLAIAHFKSLSRKDPQVIAYDLHPQYFSTRYALAQEGVKLIGVQHHHAHIAACLAENGRRGPCLGLALDGTGYGPDGTIWGGELLVADLADYKRVGRLVQVRLPGGEAAVRDPRRMAAAYLHAAFGGDFIRVAREMHFGFSSLEERILSHQLATGLNSPLTSSTGRLFDAVAAALNVCRTRTYEGQPALELEMAASEDEKGYYSVGVDSADGLVVLDGVGLFRETVVDYRAGAAPGRAAARFHNSLARLLTAACVILRDRTGLDEVALAGGVFQNGLLLTRLYDLLIEQGFAVLTQTRTPPNDGSISLGQAAVAAARLEREGG
ncbi:MAG: carbamoyltransferase HypF [Deltaproteobacteria bacterium]|nr:carbamoyltransferase HypF [Deltaproteobacteria bacterium]